MPLRTLVDTGAVEVGDIVLVGVRNLDPPEEAFIGEVGLAVGVDAIPGRLADVDAVYVALDCDVLDPAAGVPVFVPEPGGLSLEELEGLLARIVVTRPLAGAGLTGLVADERALPGLARICAALGW
jgi:arginase family enzyme